MSEYHGHLTHPDGSRTPLSAEEAKALWETCKAAAAREAELMPDTSAVLNMTCAVRNRLHKLGWSQGMYCPKGGEEFAVITAGCSAILSGCYVGDWPDGEIHVLNETHAPSEIWWKALKDLTAAEREKMDRDIRSNIECFEGELTRLAAMAKHDTRER